VLGDPLSRIDPTGHLSVGGFASSIGSAIGSAWGAVKGAFGSGSGYGWGWERDPLASAARISASLQATQQQMISDFRWAADVNAQAQRQIQRQFQRAQTTTAPVQAAHLAIRTVQDDLLSTIVGLGNNLLGIVGGFGDVLAGAISRDGRKALGGVRSIFSALVPRYGFFSGPDYGEGFEGVGPRHVIDLATSAHDQAYRRLELEGVPFLSPGRNAADSALIRGVWQSHRLGPVGQAYRLGLTAAFGLKIGMQSALGVFQ
jgi:hypothetical protein